MTTPRPKSGRAARRRLVPFVAAGLALAACGSSDGGGDSAATTAAPTTAAASATTAAAAATTAAAAATTAAPSGGSFASDADIAALCPADQKPDKLVFSTFPGQKVLIDPATESFTKLTGMDVEWLENGLGDRLTKMNAEKGAPTIDVALVPVGEWPALLANGVTEPANTKLPNYEQLIDVAKFDGGYGVSVLQIGVAYNPNVVTTPPDSWSDLLDPAYAGKVALPSMPNSGGYAMLTMLSKIGGGSEADLSKAIDQVAAFKSSAHSFIGSSVPVEPQITAGEIGMWVDIGGVVAVAKNKRNVPAAFVVPKEGGPVSINTLVVPKGSKHKGCAEAFVAWMLGEEAQKAWATNLYYGSSSSVIEFDDALTKQLFPAPGAKDIVEIDWTTISKNSATTIDLWNRKVVS